MAFRKVIALCSENRVNRQTNKQIHCLVFTVTVHTGYLAQSVNVNKVHTIIYNKPTRCNSGSTVLINNYKHALHVSDALCLHLQEHYKL